MNQPYQNTSTAAQTPPGWYPDPMGGGGERYWDGIAWSEHFTRTAQPEPAAMAPQQAFGAAPGYSPQGYSPQSPAAQPGGYTTAGNGQYVVVPNDRIKRGPSDGNGLVIAGWVFAILIPLIGLIIGAVLQSKNDDRGKAIIVVSIAVIVLNVIVMQSLGSELNSSR